MEGSSDYLKLPVDVQTLGQSSTGNKMQEKNVPEISSLSTGHLLDFLPISENHQKGNLRFFEGDDFHYQGENNVFEHSSQKAKDAFSNLLGSTNSEEGQPPPSYQRQGDECSSILPHLNGFPVLSSNSISAPARSLESSSSSMSYQPQQPELSLSSDTQTRTQECSEIVPIPGCGSSFSAMCQYCRTSFLHADELSQHSCNEASVQATKRSNVLTSNHECNKSKATEDNKILSTVTNEIPEKSHLVVRFVETCKICGLNFQSEEGLSHHITQEHSKSEENDDLFTCSFCPKVFKNPDQLEKHLSRHPFETSAIECSKCKEVFNNYILLEDHKQYEDYLSSCEICDQVFPNEECMIFHIKNSHNSFEEFMDEEGAEQCSKADPPALSNALCDEPNVNHSVVESGRLAEQVQLPSTICENPVNNQRAIQEPAENLLSQESPSVLSSPQEEDLASMNEVSDSFGQDSNVNERFCSETKVNGVDGKLSNVEKNTIGEDCATVEEGMPDESSQHESLPLNTNKHQKVKCQYCSKKCSSRKSLLRHERSHPYGTAAMKCHLCLEVVENYKALKIHKKHEGKQVTCSTCEQLFPNGNCLFCHVRNVHNSFKTKRHVESDDDSNETDNSGDNDVYDYDEKGSGDDDTSMPQYTVSRYTVSDPGAPLRITIKQEKEDVHNRSLSPNFSSSTPPTPSTPSPQAPPTPSPPPFIYESELSDSDNDDEYEPNASDQSFTSKTRKTTRRKSSLRTTRRTSHDVLFLSSSEESAKDDSPDFSYSPQSFSESEEESDDDPSWKRTSDSLSTRKRTSRRRGVLSDEESDGDPDWNGVQGFSRSTRKRGRRRKGPLSDDESDNDAEWSQTQNVSVSPKKRVSQKRNPYSEEDSDNDPDWRRAKTQSTVVNKKKSAGKRGKAKRIAYAYVIPGFVEAKAKRPRARGIGGQKAQDAAAALAEAVEDMETTVPELKTIIKPTRKYVTKASMKRYNEMYDDEHDYLLDVKPEPKEANEKQTCSSEMQVEDSITTAENFPETGSLSGNPQNHSNIEMDEKTKDSLGEEIVIKAEPYDFQEDDQELSQGSDLISYRKFSDTLSKQENSLSPYQQFDRELDEEPDSKREIRYICKICGRELQYRSHLLRHLRRVHGGEGVDEVMRRLMKCRFCSKQYSNELSLVHHEKLHDGTNKIKCTKCSEVFDDKNALRRHQRKTHWEHQPVECEICKKQLADNTCLRAHMKHMHAAEEKKVTVFTCETCGKQLHTKTAFQNHVASKCGTNLLFPCETCGKSFSFKGSLKAHQLLHSGVKSFLCKFCGKAFHQKGEMKRHERKHTGEKPFVCEICGRAFAYRESLLGHRAVHTGIKPFPCKACGMRFSCSGNLVKHRRSNNCKGSAEQSENTVVGSGSENNQVPVGNEDLLTKLDVSVTPADVTTPLQTPGSSSNQVNTDRQESAKISAPEGPKNSQSNVLNESEIRVSNMTSVIKSTPLINVKPVSALQSSPKDIKPIIYPDINQSYGFNSISNRMTEHLSPVHDSHDNSVSVHSSYTSHNLVGGYGDGHFRQPNQVNMNDRRFSQFSMDAYAGRTEQYFDRQSLLRREMSRQVIERVADRQAPKFLDCFSGVQFSGVDSRNTIQSYPAASVPHTPAYPNIHTGNLGNYGTGHNTSHSSNPVNMYASNALIPGTVSFPSFTASNHIGVGYTQSSPIPAHSVAHSSSYPSAPMSHFEALFGHLGHSSVHGTSNFPRFPSHANIGPSGNPSLPSNNHRV